MLCFTLVGKAERVPALALLLLPCDPKCCGYSMNLGQQQASNIAAQEKLQAATQERLQQQKAKQPSHGRSYGGPGLG